jgi:hypothetical protein
LAIFGIFGGRVKNHDFKYLRVFTLTLNIPKYPAKSISKAEFQSPQILLLSAISNLSTKFSALAANVEPTGAAPLYGAASRDRRNYRVRLKT